jgi:hypothetical protein
MNSNHRRIRSSLVIALALLGASVVAPRTVAGLIIQRSAIDLADLTFGEDLWSASYTLLGDLPAANQGFSVYFGADLYQSLTGSFAAAAGAWDVLLFPPDPGLPSAGVLDALSLSNTPSYTGPFTVDFIWLGGGDSLGTQTFDVYSLMNGFEILQSGQVSTPNDPDPDPTPVPESFPFAGWVILVAALLLIARKRVGRRGYSA